MNSTLKIKRKKNGSEYTYYHPECKECAKQRSAKWLKEHPENRKKSVRKYNQTEKARKLQHDYNERYRLEGRHKEWQENNREKIKQYNEYRAQNKTHNITNDEWEVCKKFFNYQCAYCGISESEAKEEYNNYFHKEHVEHDGANDISNCVPACKSCNSRKNTMTLEEWSERSEGTFTVERLHKIYEWLFTYNNYID